MLSQASPNIEALHNPAGQTAEQVENVLCCSQAVTGKRGRRVGTEGRGGCDTQ